MKKTFLYLTLIMSFFLPSSVFAEDKLEDEIKVTVIDSPSANEVSVKEKKSLTPFDSISETEESRACMGIYPYDSVTFSLHSSVEQTVPGSNISFTGIISNENEFPIIDGRMTLRVYKGKVLVDQFLYEEKTTLNGFEKRNVSFNWHVPEDAQGGEYTLMPYFSLGSQILSGFYFTNEISNNKKSFYVVSDEKGSIFLDSTKTILNESKYISDFRYQKGEGITAKVTLVNPSNKTQAVQLTWEKFSYSDLDEDNLLQKKQELISLEANQSKEVAYEISDAREAVSYLKITTQGQYQKSIQNIRVIQEGVADIIATAPTLGHFPLRADKANTLSACIYGANKVDLDGGNARLTLVDEDGNILYAKEVILGNESAEKSLNFNFTPNKNSDNVTLKVLVTDKNGEKRESQTFYSCEVLTGGPCFVKPTVISVVTSFKKFILIFAIGLPLLIVLISYVKKIKRKSRFTVLLLFFLFGASFVISTKSVDAATLDAQWKYAGPKSNKFAIAQNSYCDAGWIFTGTVDDNDNSLRHLGEEDTDGGLTQLCLRSSDPAIVINSVWTTGSCPGGTSFAQVYDDAGRALPWQDDAYIYHSTNEEDFRPDNSRAYRWCLGATGGGATSIDTRWVEWASSAYNPPCALDETQLLAAHRKGSDPYRYINPNHEDRAGSNQRSLCAKIVVTNQPPSAPTLSGPVNGNSGVSQIFSTSASDPEGNTIEYGIDWNNDSSVDEWTSFSASGITVYPSHIWATDGNYTVRVIARDSNGDSSGWSNPWTISITTPVDGTCGLANGIPTTNPPNASLCFSGIPTAVTPGLAPGPYTWSCNGAAGGSSVACSAPYLSPLPSFNFSINGTSAPGSIVVSRGGNLNIIWNSVTNAASCAGTGTGWAGGKSILGGNDNVTANISDIYQLRCDGPGGTTTKTIVVSLSNTLKICANSCSSGIEPPASFVMIQGTSSNYVACFNDATSCTDPTGNVTGGTTWSEDGGSNVLTLTGSDPKTVNANQSGSENFSASYSSQNQTKTVTVTCTDAGACSRDARSSNLCLSDTFTVVDNCGVTQNCNGAKSCDYNWKEIAP